MNEAERSDADLCPECGAFLGAGVRKCWLCGAATVELENVAAPDVVLPHLPRREASRFSYSLGLLMTVVTLICVCLGVFSIAPGVGIVFAIVITPAFVRTAIGAERRKFEGRPMDVGQKILAFGGSVGVMTTIGMAASIAFVATCFPVGMAALGAADELFPRKTPEYFLLLVWPVFPVLLGILAAGFVGYRLIRRLWRRKD